MYSRRVKNGVFVVEALNALATTYYFYYLYFFAQKKFGFGAMQNLLLAAGLGFTYMFAAFFGGKFAQKRGYFYSLRVGLLIMCVTLLVGSRLNSLPSHLLIALVTNCGMCFTWPALQALISHNEPAPRLQKLIGIYNFTWSAGSAVGFFTGGAMLEHLGLNGIFLVPAALQVVQLLLVFYLEGESAKNRTGETVLVAKPAMENHPERPAHAKTFLKMAWLANPFAYLAINTVIPIIPTLAKQLQLTASAAGVICSIWFFVRAGSFIFLRQWPYWHYRFGWLVTAYVAMIGSFAALLLGRHLAILIGAQLIFGVSLGLIYYSSLFYSMDAGEAKSESGGIHEAAIGAGSCGGPAIGAAAIYFFPGYVQSGAWAVSALLLVGLAGLFWLHSGRTKASTQV